MRCIFQLVRYTLSIWRPPDKNNTCHQLKYTSFHLKYTSHSLSGGRQILSGGHQIYLAAATYRMRCIFQLVRYTLSIWRPPDKNNTCHQLKYTSFHLKYTSHSLSGGRQILSGGHQIYLAAATYRMRCIF